MGAIQPRVAALAGDGPVEPLLDDSVMRASRPDGGKKHSCFRSAFVVAKRQARSEVSGHEAWLRILWLSAQRRAVGQHHADVGIVQDREGILEDVLEAHASDAGQGLV